jgi:hypothetical protein
VSRNGSRKCRHLAWVSDITTTKKSTSPGRYLQILDSPYIRLIERKAIDSAGTLTVETYLG